MTRILPESNMGKPWDEASVTSSVVTSGVVYHALREAGIPRIFIISLDGAEFAAADVVVEPGARALVPTGLKMAIPRGWEGQVRPKSGLALKHGISVLNTPGTVDSSYRGEVGVIVINHDPRAAYAIKKGEKIAQMVFCRVERVRFREVRELDATARGEGGFGSTGVSPTIRPSS